MLDLICQRTWNRDFDPKQDRWNVYGARFGCDNRRCYFLVDHGKSLCDSDVTVRWYQWDGESLNFVPQVLPLEIQAKLKQYPFTPPSIQDMSKTRCPPDSFAKQQSIRTKLRSDMSLSDSDIACLRQYLKERQWIKDHIESRFCSKIESIANYNMDNKDLREQHDATMRDGSKSML
ncbi:hypothetical protein C2857_000039 [Epichloe festucae Fl1]|uniref:Uncharacterized protein n=1 Tax=Epichloe festucae (strain Fl1) TaxID=877507 RepID=A0A7U3Q213_EPIFF|nr:hypothetical protein C2857_000039 [Epichloe festucae Fl1]